MAGVLLHAVEELLRNLDVGELLALAAALAVGSLAVQGAAGVAVLRELFVVFGVNGLRAGAAPAL